MHASCGDTVNARKNVWHAGLEAAGPLLAAAHEQAAAQGQDAAHAVLAKHGYPTASALVRAAQLRAAAVGRAPDLARDAICSPGSFAVFWPALASLGSSFATGYAFSAVHCSSQEAVHVDRCWDGC